MFELECCDAVKELWHGVCSEIIISRLTPNLTKVYSCGVCACVRACVYVYVCVCIRVCVYLVLLDGNRKQKMKIN